METPYSSSWGSEHNPMDDPYRADKPTTFSPSLPNQTYNNEPLPEQTHDLSLSDLLPEFFDEETSKTNSVQDPGFSYEFTPVAKEALGQEIATPAPKLETNQIYAWLTEQEQEENKKAENEDRKKFLIRAGAVVVVIGLMAVLLIVNVLLPAKPKQATPAPSTAADLIAYPGATKVETPVKLNDSLRKAFLQGQQPPPSSVEADYYLTSDPVAKAFDFYKQDMTGKGYQKQVPIDEFLNVAPETKPLNSRGVSFTNATTQGFAVVAIPVTAELAATLKGGAKAGDNLLALVSIKN